MDQATKSISISALRWTIADRVGKYVIVFFSTVILARLLGPKSFGIISMLYIFTSISNLFVDFGMGGGLIRKEDLKEVDCSTLFYFNILTAVVVYVLLFFLSPVIAAFYKEPLVTNILRGLTLTIPIYSLTLIHKELLIKELKVKFVTRASLLATIISAIIGLLCAYYGLGIWSLVILQVSQAIIYMILIWYFSPWVPSWSFSYDSLRESFGFGVGLFLSSLINTIFSNVYQVLIGLFFSITYAGLYYQAKRLFEIPILTISNVVDSISYPILVKFPRDSEILATTYGKIVKLLIFISFPLIVIMLVLSERIVIVLLGKEWLFSAHLLKILSISGLFIILETVNRSLFKIEGRTIQLFKLEVIKKVVIVLTIFLTYTHGIMIFVVGMVLNSVFSFALNQYFITVKVKEYRKVLYMLLIGIMMAGAVFYVDRFINNPILSLVISSGVGLLVYFSFSYMAGVREQKWFLSILTSKLK